MAEDRDRLRPKSGFNVVEIDDFDFPPDVCVVDHFDNQEEAVAAMEKLEGGGVVYNDKGEAVASKASDYS
jgi:hypothetical protein